MMKPPLPPSGGEEDAEDKMSKANSANSNPMVLPSLPSHSPASSTGLSPLRPQPLVLPQHSKRMQLVAGDIVSPMKVRGGAGSGQGAGGGRRDIRLQTFPASHEAHDGTSSEHLHQPHPAVALHGLNHELRAHLCSIESKLDLMNVRLECMMTEKQRKMPVKSAHVPGVTPTVTNPGTLASLELVSAHHPVPYYGSANGDEAHTPDPQGDRYSAAGGGGRGSGRHSLASSMSSWNPGHHFLYPAQIPAGGGTGGRRWMDYDEDLASPDALPSPLVLGSQSALSVASGNSFVGRFSSHGRVINRHSIRLWKFLQDSESSTGARWYSRIMTVIILASVFITILQTLDSPPIRGVGAALLETLLELIFVVDISLRLVVCPSPRTFLHDAYNVIDIVSTLPLLLRACVGFLLPDEDGKFHLVRLILLYVVPSLRLLKTLRRFETFHLLLEAFKNCVEALPILLFTLVVITLVFASAIFLVEPRYNMENYPTAMWFTIVTMTTVGYGDVVPKSTIGFCIVACLVITSLLYLAMPVGIIGQSFTKIWQDRHRILLTKMTRKRLGQWGYTASDVPRLFHTFGVTGSGLLSYVQFRRMLKKMKLGMPEDRIRALFDLADTDRSGWIDVKEFVEAVFPEDYYMLGVDRPPPKRPIGDRSPRSPFKPPRVDVRRPKSDEGNNSAANSNHLETDPLSPQTVANGDTSGNEGGGPNTSLWEMSDPEAERRKLQISPDTESTKASAATSGPRPLVVLPSSVQ